MGNRYFTVSPWQMAVAFIALFAVYQSAEGIGALLLGSSAAQGALMLAALLLAWPIGRWLLRAKGYAAYGLAWQPRVPIWIVAGLLLSVIGKAVAIFVGLRIGAYSPGHEAPTGLTFGAVAFTLLATFVASTTEDIITRGFWWRVQPIAATAARFVIASALIYVLNHVFRLGNGPAEWFMLACLGVTYAVALARTASLWAAVGLHWGWNLANGLVDGLVSLDANTAITPYLSGVTNLVLAAIVLVMPIWKAKGSTD